MDTVAKPLTDDERAAIVDLLGEGLSCSAIAKQTGRSTSTVSNIARSVGHSFGQSNLARAREARSAFCAERRASIASRLTVEAELLLDDLHGEYLVFSFGGKDNSYEEHRLAAPPSEAKFTTMRAIGQAMKIVLDIDRADNRADEGAAAVDQWLRSMLSGGET